MKQGVISEDSDNSMAWPFILSTQKKLAIMALIILGKHQVEVFTYIINWQI